MDVCPRGDGGISGLLPVMETVLAALIGPVRACLLVDSQVLYQ